MNKAALTYHFTARDGYAIERLKRDMAVEPSYDHLVQFLAYDAANFVFGFLLASGNAVTPENRRLRDEVRDSILGVLSRHGIDDSNFVVRPEIDADAPLG